LRDPELVGRLERARLTLLERLELKELA
jgi:hypothetical protein